MHVKRRIIKIDEELCDGCGQCVPSCAEGAIEIVDGKARLVAEKYCDGLGACLGKCPNGALTTVEREAEEFDGEAVEEYLSSKGQQESGEKADTPTIHSALTHWPIQIKLVQPSAPFLKGADLLVAADCTPVAYPNFHRDFLKGKVVMVGCPKFDDIQDYIRKFADIFNAADVRSITVVVMEVPCCHGLPTIVEKGMEMAGRKIPMKKVVISARGEALGREKLAA